MTITHRFWTTPSFLLLASLAGNNMAVAASQPQQQLRPQDLINLQQEFSYQDLGLENERDAETFCTRVLSALNVLPDYMTCSCQFASFRINFGCAADICLPDTFGAALGLTETCIVPSYEGSVGLSGVLSSTACNEETELVFQLGEQTTSFMLPRVCAQAEHEAWGFARLETCDFRVGEYECPCSICEGGRDVSIDCTGAVDELGPLRLFANFECIGLSLLGGGAEREPWQSPLLSLPAKYMAAKAEEAGEGN